MAKKKTIDKVNKNIENALNDLSDFEVQSIKEKYSKRSLNPFKNKKNKQQLIEEVEALLNAREIERKREERRIEMERRKEALLDTVEKTKNYVGNHSKLYSILGSIALVLISGFTLFNRWQSTVKDINFTFSNEDKFVGDYIDVSYSVEPSTAKYTNDEISIVFSNNDLIEFDSSSNNYNCVKDGDVIVKLFYNNKEYDSKTIKIKPVLVTKLYLPDIEIGRGNTLILEPTIEPDNATNKNYTISIDDTDIATVQDNKIYGVNLGKTLLHLKSADGFSYDVNVDVIDIEPTSISINGIKEKYIVGDEATATVLYTPLETTLKDIVWSSSNPNIISIDDQGKIHAINKGTATITAKFNDSVQNQKEIIVDYPVPSEIVITNNNNVMIVGNKNQLYASITPEKVSDNTIIWESSNTNVVEINENGLATAIKEGTATITAKTVNGKSNRFEIVVEATSVAASTITRSSSNAETNESSGIMVWIPKSGSKFHLNASCSKMKNPSQVTLEQAKAWGYGACGKCAKGY